MPTGKVVPSDFDAFLSEFQKESDRAAAVLGAAYLDARLEDLLRAKFAGTPGFVEDLLGTQGGLGTFSSRISTAYAVGLIALSVAQDLHLVRKIRNDFAHKLQGLTFSDAVVIQRVGELRILKAMTDEKGNPFVLALDARKQFNFAVAILAFAGLLKPLAEAPKFVEPKAPGGKLLPATP